MKRLVICSCLEWLVFFIASLSANDFLDTYTTDQWNTDGVNLVNPLNDVNYFTRNTMFNPLLGQGYSSWNPLLGTNYGTYPTTCPLLDMLNGGLPFGNSFGYGGPFPGSYGSFGPVNYGQYPGAFQGGYPLSAPPYYWNQSPMLNLQRQILGSITPLLTSTRSIGPLYKSRISPFGQSRYTKTRNIGSPYSGIGGNSFSYRQTPRRRGSYGSW